MYKNDIAMRRTSSFCRSLLKNSPQNNEKNDETKTDDCHEIIPKDRYNAVYLIFYLLGCGTLLPWNFFITANDYFKSKLNNEPDLVKKFQNYFSIASMGPNLIVMLLNVFVLHRVSRFTRMFTSLVFMIVMFGLTSSLVLIDTERWSRTFFIITLSKMVVINASVAVFQGALFGMCGMFPVKYIQAMMAGQGLGGFLAAGASILSIAGDNDVNTSAFGYFCTATFVLLISLIAYVVLERMDFVKYYTKHKGVCFCSCKCTGVCHCSNSIDWINEDSLKDKLHTSNKATYLKVFQQLLPVALSGYILFFTTLSIFPSTTARIQSMSIKKNKWTEKFFVPVSCFLFFNIFDYVGRCVAGVINKPSAKGPWLLLLCSCRLVFLPLFALCNAQPRSTMVIFNHDAYPFIFMILFAFSNGYLASLAVMYAPRRVDEKNSELAGTIMAFCIVAGLASGAAFSFVIAPNL